MSDVNDIVVMYILLKESESQSFLTSPDNRECVLALSPQLWTVL